LSVFYDNCFAIKCNNVDNSRMDTKLPPKETKAIRSVTSTVDSTPCSEVYAAPQLVEYGNLAELTQFGGSGSSDFMGMQDGMGN
jgi:hypothetical protein